LGLVAAGLCSATFLLRIKNHIPESMTAVPAMQPITIPATSPPLKFTRPLVAATGVDVELEVAAVCEPDDEDVVADAVDPVEAELAVKAIERSDGISQLSTL